MSRGGNCNHSEFQHVVMEMVEQLLQASFITLNPMVATRGLAGSEAILSMATWIFSTALETGIRSAQIDPIGAQLMLDHLDSLATGSKDELAEANQIMAADARTLLETIARQMA